MSVVSVALAAGVLAGVLVHPGWTRVSRGAVVARSAPLRGRSVRATVLGGARARVTGGGGGGAGEGGPRGLPGVRGLLRWVLRRRGPVGAELGIVCASVAARVRSGQEPGAAWASELGVSPGSGGGRRTTVDRGRVRSADPGVDGVSLVGSERVWLAGATVAAEGLPPELLALVGRSPGADAAYVATRVAVRSGAPLADVLDAVAVAVAEAEAAEADRRRARAGPATTARLLGWLPLGALLLGAGLGADPVAVVVGGGPGLLALVAGLLLMVTGRWWSARLVRAATVDDDGPATRARG